MLQLTNNTPFAATLTILPDEQGVESIYITVKASFKIGPDWVLAEPQAPVQAEDVYRGDPESSSLKYSTDIHVGKPATDIIMTGEACAPDSAPVRQLDVSLCVGDVKKVVRVFGDRFWRKGRIVGPEPFTRMPMVYERAFGGKHWVDGKLVVVEARNPVGVGLSGADAGRALPNLEDPDNPIESMNDRPEPACFAARAPGWLPRAGFAGTYDAAWQETRAPYLPDDFDSRFLNVAHPELVYDGYLQGGEPVEVSNMHPKGKLSFTLPRINLVGRVDVGGRTEAPFFNLETLLLEPNRLQLALVWKAKVQCDKQTMKIRQAVLSLSR